MLCKNISKPTVQNDEEDEEETGDECSELPVNVDDDMNSFHSFFWLIVVVADVADVVIVVVDVVVVVVKKL